MNVELAMQTPEVAKAHPENFDMDVYFSMPAAGILKTSEALPPLCGTAACYAGFASLVAAPAGTRIVHGSYGSEVNTPDGTSERVSVYAQKALGITTDQADFLFNLADIHEVEAAVRHLAGNPDATEDSLREAVYG